MICQSEAASDARKRKLKKTILGKYCYEMKVFELMYSVHAGDDRLCKSCSNLSATSDPH